MQKKIQKKFLVSEITASEVAAVKCLYYEGNTCHSQSMRQETVLRLCISVREIVPTQLPSQWSKTFNGGVLHIWTVLVAVHEAASQSVLWSRTFLNALRKSFKTLHISKRDFFLTQLPPETSINMLNVPQSRFQQCLFCLTMPVVKVSSQTGFF